MLGRWDLHNLRALLRLPSSPVGGRDVSALLVPAGRLSEAELAELAAQPDARGRLDLIVAWQIPTPATATMLARARVGYESEGDTSTLERALDAAFAARLVATLGEARGKAATVLRAEIDLRNLTAALRFRSARLEREPEWSARASAYVEGGLVAPGVWEQVRHLDPAEAVVAHLADHPLPTGWDRALIDWAAHENLPVLEARLQQELTRAADALFTTGDVLGFDIPVAFTFAKEAEARNLRLVGRTLVHQLPMNDVESRIEAAQ